MAAATATTPPSKRARKKRDKSAQQIKVDTLRKKYDDMPEGSSVEKLTAMREELERETRILHRQTFERVAGGYTAMVMTGLEKLKALGRSRRVLFVDDDIETIGTAVSEAVDDMSTFLKASLSHAPAKKDKHKGVVFAPLTN